MTDEAADAREESEAVEDPLRLGDLVPARGGEWSGLLFDDPAIGLAPVRAVATVSGDLDGLGIGSVDVAAWLSFTGIWVSLSDAPTPQAALARLQDRTDVTGLSFSPDPAGNAFRFAPAGP